MPKQLLIICCCLIGLNAISQVDREQVLIQKAVKAPNDSTRIAALNELAERYYIFKLEKKADSIINIELQIAELSTNKNLILTVLFNNVVSNIGYWTSIETFDRAYNFLQKGLNYAKETSRQDYEAIAYIRMASLLRKRNDFDKAIEKATLAFSALGNLEMDSLKATMYLEMGDIFLGKGDAASAYRNYNNAFDLAYENKNIELQSETYHHLAGLYQFLVNSDFEKFFGNRDLAKQNLLKSLALNTQYNNKKGLFFDYVDLGKLTDDKTYITKAAEIASELKSDYYQLWSKRLMFAYLTVYEKDVQVTLNYLNQNEDLKSSYMNMGMANYYWNVGNVYNYAGKTDSALYYYLMAEPGLTALLDKSKQLSIYMDIGSCYDSINNIDKAIQYYKKALDMSQDQSNDAAITMSLSRLYDKAGEFKKAYEYLNIHLKYMDSLNSQASSRNITQLDMERETFKREKDQEELARMALNKRNLQFMAISIAIAGFFFLMILIGMFPVSKFTIKLMGYFAFICLFEFLVLLIDTYLHKLTHGEPLKTWLIKIFLIALLVPFQHFLEHGMIRFIESKKLIRLRSRISIRKVFAGIRKQPVVKKPDQIDKVEEDTAVL